MPLRRLTALAKLELEEEAAGLRADIDQYNTLLEVGAPGGARSSSTS